MAPHIRGGEHLQNGEFEDEVLDFLHILETTDQDAELNVNCDAFELWEFTEPEEMEKFDAPVESVHTSPRGPNCQLRVQSGKDET